MRETRVWKVLIIEDERIDREIYKRYLELSSAYQFEFAECDSGAAGIAMCREWSPDCILLDFNLPDMDGLDLLPALRDESQRLPCAVVMLTACGGEALAVSAMKGGAMDYLPKGHVAADVLPHTVINAIERFQMQRRIDEQRSALERSTAQYQTLLEAIPNMVWMATGEGRISYANRQWFDYTGYAGPGNAWEWDDLLHPEDRERTRTAWQDARDAGTVFEIEHRLKRAADGSYRWHLVRAVPFRGPAGEISIWFGTCTEIEDHKQAEESNLQAQKLQGIGQLAAGVAHDFNNLLVVILGGASYALESIPPRHEARGMLEGVVRAGERAAELTGKMLAYAGEGALYVERTDLNRLVRDTCNSLRASIPPTIQIDIRPAPDRATVFVDTRQMRQVIVDLVRNAAESIREGAAGVITVRTAIEEVSETTLPAVAAGTYVALEVRDNGCGMDEELQQKIFDPFFSTKFAGRGLGLAAVHGFVRSSGGGVQVDSSPGQGTRFRILLPVESLQTESLGMTP